MNKTSMIITRMSEIKSVNITGGAADAITGGAKKRRITKRKQDGGAEEIRGVSPVMAAVKGVESPSQLAGSAAPPSPSNWLKYPEAAPVPPKVIPAPSYVPAPNAVAAPHSTHQLPLLQQQQGGAKHVRVELKKKTTAKKVHLNPKKAHHEQKAGKKHQTKKARKVTIGVSSLHKRITRAKKLHKEVKEMPIEKLKSKLIADGLIKPHSTAPEAVIRQIAHDAEIVSKKAL